MEAISEEITEIQNPFLNQKLMELELGTRFKNSIPKRCEGYSVLQFLEEFDPSKQHLIGCAKKELDLFRLHLEANAIDWHKYKIKFLFKKNYFIKGAFFDKDKLKSGNLNFTYKRLHSKRKEVESIQLKLGF